MKKLFRLLIVVSLTIMTQAAGTELVGSIEGDIQINNGRLSYQLPILAPEDAFGLTPSISINYTQGGGNDALGIGFGMGGISKITRCSATDRIDDESGGIGFNASDKYCLDGKRLVLVGSDDYKIYNSLQTKIKRFGPASDPTYWRVWNANGHILDYGTDDKSKISVDKGTLNWKISNVQDRFGHEAVYTYMKKENVNYIDEITYNHYKLKFNYISRTDSHEDYIFGLKRTHNTLLQEIQVTSNDKLFYTYKLDYNAVDASISSQRLSKLRSVKYCDKDEQCLNPVVFNYAENNILEEPEDSILLKVDELLNYVVADLDNDGLNDVCYYDGSLKCAFNKGNGEFSEATVWTSTLDTRHVGFIEKDYSEDDKEEKKRRDAISSTLTLLDINNDQKIDYCVAFEEGIYCGRGDGSSSFKNSHFYTESFTIEDAYRFTDINQDKLIDICAFTDKGLECALNENGVMNAPVIIEERVKNLQIKQTYTSYHFTGLNGLQVLQNGLPDACEKRESYTYDDYDSVNCEVKTNEVKMPQPQMLDINHDGFMDICGFTDDDHDFHCAMGTGYDNNKYPTFGETKVWGENFPLGDNDKIYKIYRDNEDKKALSREGNITERFNRTIRMADLNNDGLTDICYKRENDLECRINNGQSFNTPKVWITLPSLEENKALKLERRVHLENTIQLGDKDGDGVADLMLLDGSNLMVAVNAKDHFAPLSQVATILPDMDEINTRKKIYTRPIKKWFGLKTEFHNVQTWLAYGPIKQIADTDGKNNIEVCYRGFEGLSCLKLKNQPLALLDGVTNSLGLETKITYGHTLTDNLYDEGNDAVSPVIDKPVNTFVVSKVETDDAVGGTSSLEYRYGGFKMHEEKGGLGFAQITTVNSLKRSKTITTFDRSDSELNGKVLKTEGYIDNKLISSSQKEYELVDTPHSKIQRARLLNSMSQTYDLKGVELSTKTITHTRYNDFDQLEVSSEKITDSTGLDYTKTITTQFNNDTSSWLLAKPKDIKVEHTKDGGSLTKHSTFEYGSKGELKKQVLEPGDKLALTTEYTWNSDRTTRTTDISGADGTRTAVSGYDTYGRLVSTSNVLGQTSQIMYDDLCDKPLKVTDINGLQSSFAYDGLCRKVQETLLDNTTVITTNYEWSDHPDMGTFYAGMDTPDRDNTVYMVSTESTLGQWSKVYYDAMNREIREITQGSEDAEIYTDYAYNTKGELLGKTIPYYGSNISLDRDDHSGEQKPAEWLNAKWITFERDVLGRVIKQTQPSSRRDIVTSMAHDGFTVTSTSPKQFTKVTKKNALDQTIEIVENDGSVIKFEYDVSGNVVKTDANTKLTTIEYDKFNRKTSMTDVSLGHWSYVYNTFGELIQETDAKGQTTSIEYDELGRVTSKQQGEKSTTFIYDTAANGKGKLASSSNGLVTKTYSYDTLGRVTQMTQGIDEKEFKTAYTYDEASRVSQITYPSGLHLNYNYELNGLLEKITVPKKEIWDFSYMGAEKALEETAAYIYTLQKTIADMEQKVLTYTQNAEKYRALALSYASQMDVKQSELDQLDQSRQDIVNLIGQYNKKLRYLRSRASNAVRQFGNRTFTYVKTVGGNHYFKYSKCVKKNGKGHCKRYENYSTTVPSWVGAAQDITTETFYSADEGATGAKTNRGKFTYGTCITEPLNEYKMVQDAQRGKYAPVTYHEEQKFTKTCNWGPKKNLNIGRTFNQEADYYERLIAEQNTKKSFVESEATTVSSDIVELRSLQQQAQANALANHKDAVETNALLEKNLQELANQINTQKEAQETLDARDNDETDVTLWRATSRSPQGQVQGEYYGNGLLTTRYYDPSGTIDRIKTGYGTKLIRDIRYSYDERNNIISKADPLHHVTENYSYDDLDRIASWQYKREGNNTKTINRNYEYDLDGNIEFKTGIGQMTYNDKNQLTYAGGLTDFSYDDNGNMLSGNQKSYSYTAFNKVQRINYLNGYQDHYYDESDTIVKKVYKNGKTVYYIGDSFEVTVEQTNEGENTIMKHHIKADGKMVATYIRTVEEGKKQVDKTAYIHRDALGSVDTVTDNHGDLALRNEYTPYGENIATIGGNGTFERGELRGYTGHKQIPEANLINMNARLYDPVIARFISPDTMIPHPDMIQSYNRYAYVYGNPIRYTDPSGHFIVELFILGVAIFTVGATSDDPTISKWAMTIGSIMMMGADMGMSAIANGATVGFTTGFISSGGDMHQAIKSAVLTGASAGLTEGIGHGFGDAKTSYFSENSFGQFTAHGIAQGTITAMRGGKFGSGFISGIIGKTSGVVMKTFDFEVGSAEARYGGASIAALFGGLASEATGGKFQDGAMSAVMVYLFNDMQTIADRVALGDPIQKAEISANASMYAGVGSAGLLAWKNPFSQIGGRVLAGVSGFMAFNSHMLLLDAGEFDPDLFAVEMLTVVTHYPPIPMIDFVYDETFVRITDFLTDASK